MNLYTWQPNGHGELSWFVVADTEDEARAAVELEIERRKALPEDDPDRIREYQCSALQSGYYGLTVARPGVVVTNAND